MHHLSPVLWWSRVLDAVDGRVAQVDVGAGHVDLGAQHHRAVGRVWPSRISRKRARFSAGVRVRKGLSVPGV
jgi:hypothetical protein